MESLLLQAELTMLAEQEMLTGNAPYGDIQNEPAVLVLIGKGELPKEPSGIKEWDRSKRLLWEICQMCWRLDAQSRPSASEILTELEVA